MQARQETPEKWSAPVYPLGTRVMCSTNGNAKELVHLGRIIRQCGGGLCSIAVDETDDYGRFTTKNCASSYHADDPKLHKFSPEFWSEENCIYRIAEIDKHSLELLPRMAEIEKMLAITSAASPLPKRSPGRPRSKPDRPKKDADPASATEPVSAEQTQ